MRWSFLLLSGYLKTVSQERDIRLYCDLAIPNQEVRYLYEDIVLKWFQADQQADLYDPMLDALLAGDTETFADIFRDLVLTTFSYFDTSGKRPEKVYHAFVLGLLVRLRDTYEVRSNRESGYGRYDVMLIPKQAGDGKRKGIVIEFKNARAGETPEDAAAAAIRQIEEKRYAEELQSRGVRDIVLLGVAFAGKEVRIASRSQGT